MNGPVQIAVVGHTNAGKTSLLRTLTRQRGFGDVSSMPGTTRHVEAQDLRVNGAAAVRFFDTPGLEDSVALQAYLADLGPQPSPADRVRAFLAGPEAARSFEQEAKVLRKMIEADVGIYVIDARTPVLPKYHAEIDILTGCARPLMPVLNFAREAGANTAVWIDALKDHNLHVQAVFDVVAPAIGAEDALYRSLAFVLPQHKPLLNAVLDDLASQRAERRDAACTAIADVLVQTAALRREMTADEFADEALRQKHVRFLRKHALQAMRNGIDDLLQIYGFDPADADDAVLPWLEGRWESDLFDPEVLREAGMKLGTGAAVGATVGFAADLALAGMSLGAATALGAAVGGAASQGWSQLGRRIVNKARRIQELTVENAVLHVAATQLLNLLAALEQRGHGAVARVTFEDVAHVAKTELDALLGTLQAARSYPAWADASGSDTGRRARFVAQVADRVRAAADVVIAEIGARKSAGEG